MRKLIIYSIVLALVLGVIIVPNSLSVSAREGSGVEVELVEVTHIGDSNGIMLLSANGTGCRLKFTVKVNKRVCSYIYHDIKYTYGIKNSSGNEYAKITSVTPSVDNVSGAAYCVKKSGITTKYTTTPARINTSFWVYTSATNTKYESHKLAISIAGNGNISVSDIE